MVIILGDSLGKEARAISLRIKRQYKVGIRKTKNWNAKKVNKETFRDKKGNKKTYKNSGLLILYHGKRPYWYRADGFFIDKDNSIREVFN